MTVDTREAAAPSVRAAGESIQIRLEAVEKLYRTDRIETLALSGIDLEIRRGELISIMGPSGSGKSTLLHIMGLIDAPSKGRLVLNGSEVNGEGDRKLARIRNREIGFVFQSFHLIPDLRVADNVEIPLLYRGMGARERRERVNKALERVGLGARKNHFPTQLSGGQQQRVAVARAVVGEPAILLADEPTGNLDSQMGAEIMAILEELHRVERTTVVMVTHDQRLADRTERTIRLFDGRLVH